MLIKARIEGESVGAFCDFLSIYQEHDPLSTPQLNAGRVVKLKAWAEDHEQVMTIVDEDGVIICDGGLEFTTASAIEHEGSFDTSILIKSEGGRVTLSGNVGRFGRPDNVFGYSVIECVRIANVIVTSLGLPPFTWRGALSSNVIGVRMKVDAVVTRVDLTRNYVAGSPEKLARLLHYMGGMHVRNKGGKSYEAGVTWGEGSKYWYAKIYDKYRDLAKSKHVSGELVEWVRDCGIARFEVSLKSRFLSQQGMQSVGFWEGEDMSNVVYGRFSEVLSQMTVNVDQFEEIPGRLGEIAIAWRNGVDMRERLPKSSFYRFRKALKAYGIDISERCNVSRLPMRVEVIQLSEARRPDWYELPLVA